MSPWCVTWLIVVRAQNDRPVVLLVRDQLESINQSSINHLLHGLAHVVAMFVIAERMLTVEARDESGANSRMPCCEATHRATPTVIHACLNERGTTNAPNHCSASARASTRVHSCCPSICVARYMYETLAMVRPANVDDGSGADSTYITLYDMYLPTLRIGEIEQTGVFMKMEKIKVSAN